MVGPFGLQFQHNGIPALIAVKDKILMNSKQVYNMEHERY